MGELTSELTVRGTLKPTWGAALAPTCVSKLGSHVELIRKAGPAREPAQGPALDPTVKSARELSFGPALEPADSLALRAALGLVGEPVR